MIVERVVVDGIWGFLSGEEENGVGVGIGRGGLGVVCYWVRGGLGDFGGRFDGEGGLFFYGSVVDSFLVVLYG